MEVPVVPGPPGVGGSSACAVGMAPPGHRRGRVAWWWCPFPRPAVGCPAGSGRAGRLLAGCLLGGLGVEEVVGEVLVAVLVVGGVGVAVAAAQVQAGGGGGAVSGAGAPLAGGGEGGGLGPVGGGGGAGGGGGGASVVAGGGGGGPGGGRGRPSGGLLVAGRVGALEQQGHPGGFLGAVEGGADDVVGEPVLVLGVERPVGRGRVEAHDRVQGVVQFDQVVQGDGAVEVVDRVGRVGRGLGGGEEGVGEGAGLGRGEVGLGTVVGRVAQAEDDVGGVCGDRPVHVDLAADLDGHVVAVADDAGHGAPVQKRTGWSGWAGSGRGMSTVGRCCRGRGVGVVCCSGQGHRYAHGVWS